MIDPETIPDPVAPDAVASTPRTTRPARLWDAAIGAALLASVLSWAAGEVAVQSLPEEKEQVVVNGQHDEIVTVLSSNRSAVRKAASVLGIQGAVLGLCLGLAGGSGRRSIPAAARAALLGMILGAAAGMGGSIGFFPILLRNLDPISGDLMLPMLAHAAVWAVVGLAGGLAFGVGLGGGARRVARSALGGLIGAVLGAAVYELVGAFVFSQAKTDQPIADSALARLLAQFLLGVTAAAFAAAALRLDRSVNHPRVSP